MDNIRLFLFMALAFLGMLLYQSWQEDYGPKLQEDVAQATSTTATATTGSSDVPNAQVADGTLPNVPGMEAATQQSSGSKLVKIKTDMLDLLVDTRGASIVEARLMDYPVSVEKPDVKFRLLSNSPSDFFIAQSGLLANDKARAPTHQAIFNSSADEFVMSPGQESMDVDFTWQSADGVSVTKRYTFTRGKHTITLQHLVNNASATPWVARDYRQLQRGEPASSGNAFMHTFTGGAIYSQQDKYQKYDLEKLADGKLNMDVTDGWIAMIQHYFLAAFVPPRGEQGHFYSQSAPNGRSVIGTYSQPQSVAPGSSATFSGKMFIGPKLQEELAGIAEGLDLTVDYSWLVFIAKPMYWVLEQIESFVHNWGWTIIIFTILIKLAFFKLSETSYRSMANMRKLTPRIQALKDRYGDDKQRMQQAMMEMYKTEKINPLGGCLPMLVQIPFFIALYWVLLESVELRQAPWILWINDLSIKDPYFVLPLIMGVSMFVQQKLNPPPPDPMQAKIMMALPVVFTAMFAFFPSGLVLYWVVNNLLSITQQWIITKRIEEGAKA